MRGHRGCLSLAMLGLAVGSADAQPAATTVQLPTFSSFSVGTTVSVPDRGSAYLGGVSRAASGRSEFGVPLLPWRPFRNVGIGRELSTSGMFVTATIHDFDAMDPYLRAPPSDSSSSLGDRRSQVVASGRTLRPADRRAGASWRLVLPAAAGGPPKMSVAEARAERARQGAARAKEVAQFFERGQQAEAAGKPGVAKVYYQMAARQATGELKDQIVERLGAVRRAPGASAPAQTRP